jgi:hypothetical protein
LAKSSWFHPSSYNQKNIRSLTMRINNINWLVFIAVALACLNGSSFAEENG